MAETVRTILAAVQLAAPPEGGAEAPSGLRPIEIDAYGGGLVDVGYGPEVFDLQGLEVASGQIPLLVEHDVHRVAGFSAEFENDGKSLRVLGQLFTDDDEPEGQRISRRASKGYVPQASVRVEVLEEEFVPEGETREINGRTLEGPFIHDKKSRLRETSVCSLGADSTTRAVALSAANPEEAPAMDAEAILKKERERVASIRSAFPDHPDFANKHIDEGSTLDQARLAHAPILQAELKTQREALAAAQDELAKTKAEAEKARTAQASGTVPFSRPRPSGAGVGGDEEGSARDRFLSLVTKLEDKGLSRQKAVRKASADRPDLHKAWLEEHNPEASVPQYLRQNFNSRLAAKG